VFLVPIGPLALSLYPAPPAQLSSGSVAGWLLLAMILALVVTVGLVLASRRLQRRREGTIAFP
jgi:uncharacterized membrane protein